MANRTFNQDAFLVAQKKVVCLFPTFSVGAAGAVTLKKRIYSAGGASSLSSSTSLGNAPTTGTGYAVGDGAGVRSVLRTGAGAWTVTLSDPYQWLISVEVVQVSNATGLIATPSVGIVASTTIVTTNTAPGSGGVVTLVFNNSAGAATDPANGDTITLQMILGDATEP